MNPEGLERPQIPRRGTLAEFRARLNLEPTRFIIGKSLFPYCQGERDEGRIYGETGVFLDRFLGEAPLYQYEEVNLSTITENDVVLFADADIPFWIAKSMTEKTITFAPCAIWKRIGIHNVYGIRGDHRANKYQYARRPMDNSMDICDKYWIEHPNRENMDKILTVEGNENNLAQFTVRKTKILRNGEQIPIKVRKFTGTDEQMVLMTDFGHETSHKVYDLIIYRRGITLHAKNWRGVWEETDDEETRDVGAWADRFA